jgi:hypothetical protein
MTVSHENNATESHCQYVNSKTDRRSVYGAGIEKIRPKGLKMKEAGISGFRDNDYVPAAMGVLR